MGRPKKVVEETKEELIAESVEQEDTNELKQPTLHSEDLSSKLLQKDEEINQMKIMMMQMQQQIMMLSQQNQPVQQAQGEEYVSIYKSIPVMSMYDGMLNISTKPNGRGKIYTFNRFGEVRNIVYNDLRDVIASHFNFAKDGMFYIMDDKVVEENGLTDYYKDILTKNQLEQVMEQDKNLILDTFPKINKSQQEVIVDILTRKIAMNEDVDLNKVAVISESIGKDIREMAKDLAFSLKGKLEK